MDQQFPVQLWVGRQERVLPQLQEWVARHWCVRGGTTACGSCRSCEQVRQRAHAALVWMRPDRGIYLREVVEVLVEQLKMNPADDGMQVMVIEHAEALTPTSGNLLLKTIEEPPQGWHIVFTAERPHMVLVTLRSRCMEHRITGAGDASSAAVREGYALLLEASWKDIELFDVWLSRTQLQQGEVRELFDAVVHRLLVESTRAGTPVATMSRAVVMDEYIRNGVALKIVMRLLYVWCMQSAS